MNYRYRKSIYWRIGFSFLPGKGKALANLFLIGDTFEEIYKRAPDAAMFVIMSETTLEKDSTVVSGDTISGLEITAIEQVGPVMLPIEEEQIEEKDPQLDAIEQMLLNIRDKRKAGKL